MGSNAFAMEYVIGTDSNTTRLPTPPLDSMFATNVTAIRTYAPTIFKSSTCMGFQSGGSQNQYPIRSQNIYDATQTSNLTLVTDTVPHASISLDDIVLVKCQLHRERLTQHAGHDDMWSMWSCTFVLDSISLLYVAPPPSTPSTYELVTTPRTKSRSQSAHRNTDIITHYWVGPESTTLGHTYLTVALLVFRTNTSHPTSSFTPMYLLLLPALSHTVSIENADYF
ncbi:hypothetical protein A0H81_02174 [Grifola frondosa]|uniref:Uncharacterized protein n=1 Tax=Grifola frondosa TaxID=5627 RepID=A0A1C7MN09_GRIFR|nr:hypothetical protein A0H81_02174 [Grifola frondosa]